METLILTIKLVLLLYISGLGLSSIILPKSLKSYTFFISPWLGTIGIVVASVYMSMAGFTMEQASRPIFLISSLLFLHCLLRDKAQLKFSKVSLSVLIMTSFILLYNIWPMIFRVGYPTVMSLGNLDPVAYATTGDYLIKNSVFGGDFQDPFVPSVASASDLITYSFRWGSGIIFSYFAVLLNTRSYEIFTTLISIFFALTYPLVYVLAVLIYKKDKLKIAVLTFLTYGINSTLLYILYNAFFGQIIFGGLIALTLVLLCQYLSDKLKTHNLNHYDLTLGLILSSITTIYPEGYFLAVFPMLIYGATQLITKNVENLFKIVKIIILSIIFNPFTFGTMARWFIRMVKVTTIEEHIGWEAIRHAFPAEALGFYNLNYYRDLPILFDVILTVVILGIAFLGFLRIKNKLLILSYAIFFIGFLFLFKFIKPNFFVYHRTITYSVFLFSAVFSIGMTRLFDRFNYRLIIIFVFGIMIFLSLRSANRTMFQFASHHRSVDRPLISLIQLDKNTKIKKPFVTSDVYFTEYDLWNRVWTYYFLNHKKIITKANYVTLISEYNVKLPVLTAKNKTSNDDKVINYKKIIWENEFYQLGRIEPIPVSSEL